MSRRHLVALVLALVASGAGAAAYVATRGADAVAGTHAVRIEGPAGTLFDDSVSVERATALSVLLAAAGKGGFGVEVDEYPGLGAYVRAIAGHEASGTSGWIYEVSSADGGWVAGDRSAALRALAPGEAVRWRWIEA